MFADRTEAGIALAKLLKELHLKRPLVLALTRGGVPVGFEIAKSLKCLLDCIVTRKVGAPFNPNFPVGVVAPGGIFVLDEASLRSSGVSVVAVEGTVEEAKKEMARRIDIYRSGTYSIGYVPGTIILVDDGIITGSSMLAAALAVRKRYKKVKIVVAVPVCLDAISKELKAVVDEIVCAQKSTNLFALSQAYEEFNQVSDTEVVGYLKTAAQ